MDRWSPLAEGQSLRKYLPGQLIYQQGEAPATFYYLISGTARSFISSAAGGERVLTAHGAGDLMGEASFFDERPRVSSAVAVTACQVVPVDRQQLNEVFRRHPDLALPMLQYLARTVRLLSGHVDGMSFLRADQRLAQHLLDLDVGGPISCTHEELGLAIGVSRVTVSRVLAEFGQKGWVETGYRSVTVQNRDGLENI